jgi:predicted ATPase
MLIRNLKVSRLLSFGPEGIDLPMRSLNVLIGANGCGKSNFVEVLNLLRYAPVRFDAPIMTGGGVKEWLWKGGEFDLNQFASIEAEVINNFSDSLECVRHRIDFGGSSDRVLLDRELIACGEATEDLKNFTTVYSNHGGNASIRDDHSNGKLREMDGSKLDFRVSILSQIRDPELYDTLDFLQRAYNGIHIYRDWTFGTSSPMRSSQVPDGPVNDVGREGRNAVTVVASMKRADRNRLVKEMQSLYPEIEDVRVAPAGAGAMQLFIEEGGGVEISAERLSDGTLRFLFLLAILLQPEPPPMIVIEEPELGLHPDVIPKLAALLIEASERTQIVLTTHSRMLVDALGDDPESVIVCEKHNGESTFERLDGERMKVWLEKYSLGDLWSKGEIGGNRW